jgi:hypothetical protein
MTELGVHSPPEPPRDRWKRPLIIPPAGGDPIPYTRVSTLAKTLDDSTALTLWKQRVTAVGLLRRTDLRDRVAGVMAKHRADPVADGKTELNRILRDATEAGGASAAAGTGTALHQLTEAIDRGEEPDVVPEQWLPALAAYRAAMAPFEVLGLEQFVVADDVQAAGTFDRLVCVPDGRVLVADLKTGKHDAGYPLSVATQIATYAHGLRYDPSTGQRAPLHPDIDLDVGLLIHLPATTSVCTVYEVNLRIGWRAAQLAAHVRAMRGLTADELRREWDQ